MSVTAICIDSITNQIDIRPISIDVGACNISVDCNQGSSDNISVLLINLDKSSLLDHFDRAKDFCKWKKQESRFSDIRYQISD